MRDVFVHVVERVATGGLRPRPRLVHREVPDERHPLARSVHRPDQERPRARIRVPVLELSLLNRRLPPRRDILVKEVRERVVLARQPRREQHKPVLRGERGVLLVRDGEEEEVLRGDTRERRVRLLLADFEVARERRVHQGVVVDGHPLRELGPRGGVLRDLLRLRAELRRVVLARVLVVLPRRLLTLLRLGAYSPRSQATVAGEDGRTHAVRVDEAAGTPLQRERCIRLRVLATVLALCVRSQRLGVVEESVLAVDVGAGRRGCVHGG